MAPMTTDTAPAARRVTTLTAGQRYLLTGAALAALAAFALVTANGFTAPLVIGLVAGYGAVACLLVGGTAEGVRLGAGALGGRGEPSEPAERA